MKQKKLIYIIKIIFIFSILLIINYYIFFFNTECSFNLTSETSNSKNINIKSTFSEKRVSQDLLYFQSSDKKIKNYSLRTSSKFCGLFLIKNCLVWSDHGLILNKKKQVLNETIELISKNKYLVKYLSSFKTKKTNFVKGTGFLLTGQYSDCYFHWLLDIIPKLSFIDRCSSIDYVVLPKNIRKFHLDTLWAYGIKNKKFFFLDDNICEFENLYVSHIPTFIEYKPNKFCYQIHKFQLDFLRDQCNFSYQSIPAYSKIYISRENSSKRKIVNENELMKLLEKYGFKRVFFEDYDFNEQVTLIKNAKYIIAPHGAGLSNLVYCEPKTKVCEVLGGDVKFLRFPRNNDYQSYYRICKLLGIEHEFFFGELVPGLQDCTHDINSANITVDLKSFESFLKNFF